MTNAVGNQAVSTTSVEIVPEDGKRWGLVLEHTTGDVVWFAFGVAAEVGKGFSLSSSKTNYEVPDRFREQAVNAICDTGESATIAFMEV